MIVRQLIIVSTIVTISFVILVSGFWQLIEIKSVNANEIERTFLKTKNTIATLINLKSSEMTNTAESIINSTMARSALQTKDQETINAVLINLLKQYNLASIDINILGDSLFYKVSDSEKSNNVIVSNSARANWNSNIDIKVSGRISAENLTLWSEITGTQLSLLAPTVDDSHYSDEFKNEHIQIGIGISKNLFNENIRKHRNRLILFSFVVFLIGLVFSIAVATLFDKKFSAKVNSAGQDNQLWKKLLTDIEALKKSMPAK